MRRRPMDFRRPVRRRLSNVVWWTICGLVVLFFIIIFSKESQIESRPSHAKASFSYFVLFWCGRVNCEPVLGLVADKTRGISIFDVLEFLDLGVEGTMALNWQKPFYHDRIMEGLNITDEMLSPNSVTRQLSDQINLAKAFVAIAKESNNLQFAWELSAQIRNSQVLLSSAATRRAPLTTRESETAIRDMALLLYQAQQLHYDSATMIMRLRAKIQALEEQKSSVTEKSSKYGQIAAEEVPKGLYCLVVVNSTALNSKNPNMVVFHLVTDEINYAAMKAWFAMNDFGGVTVEVQKFEDFKWLNASYVPVLKQLQDSETQNYYFSGHSDDGRTPIKFRNPKYLSMLNHLRFYIPEVFPALKKVVFLDDDVVTQKDLSALFSIDLNGNVNGAVETCMETFHRYHKYLNYSHPLIREHFDPDACGWAFGMNVFDLVEWRRRNVTNIYHYWQERNVDRTLWKLGTLPPGLLTFYGLTQPLDPSWHVLGLGYTNVDHHLIEKGAVLHFNGNSKPWLKIGMEKYKPLWEKYVDYSHHLLQQCNFH
ncbi:hypothetical protein GH714_043502 [Hevea brasiliensis]|uniref:Hexosyltransferase n=1 Tax=Hevea brasiliensis TaxID=3981 RepID=A0A6A6K363_HEVBR|nr:hypothetical protein GH714_043502 [Hevea brasiliensis]